MVRPLCHLPRETEVQDSSMPCLLRTSDSPPQAQGRFPQKSPGALNAHPPQPGGSSLCITPLASASRVSLWKLVDSP